MPIQFPTSPSVNQEYTYEGKVWQWDGSAWVGVRQETGIQRSNIWSKQNLLIPKRGFGLNSGYSGVTDQRRTQAGTIPMLKHYMERNLVPTYDADAQAYFDRVEGPTGDNQTLETSVKTAINDFVVGCKADGIWSAIKASCIMAGARTLAGAFQPLLGTAPTSFNFVSGDYDRKTGLLGDGSAKYLNTNRNNNADPQDNQHISVWVSTAATSTASTYPIYIGAGALGVGVTHMGRLASNGLLYFRNRNNEYQELVPGSAVGLLGMSRSSSSSYVSRVAGVSANQNATSQTPFNQSIIVFAAGPDPNRPSNGRLAFYSIGESLDLALLDTRVTALMTALDAAIA